MGSPISLCTCCSKPPNGNACCRSSDGRHSHIEKLNQFATRIRQSSMQPEYILPHVALYVQTRRSHSSNLSSAIIPKNFAMNPIEGHNGGYGSHRHKSEANKRIIEMEDEDQRLEMLKGRRLGTEQIPHKCELNDRDDLGGEQEGHSVDRVVDGDVDRVLRIVLGCRCRRANSFRLQTSFPGRYVGQYAGCTLQ